MVRIQFPSIRDTAIDTSPVYNDDILPTTDEGTTPIKDGGIKQS